MKLKKIDPQTAERKPCYMQDYIHEHGRSRVIVKCPFCGRANIAYTWSLAGSGKRCENDSCRAHLCWGIAVRDMVPVETESGPLDMDPSTIDLEMACAMTYGRLTEPLSYKANRFPQIIDFDELEKIEPPKGYTFKIYSRDLKIDISTFRGMCPGAVHYYCQIEFHSPSLYKGNTTGFGYGWPEVGKICRWQKMDENRPITERDLADKYVDWTGYRVGDMTHRWTNIQNAIKCAKKVIKLRFRNYGKIEVENNT